MLLPLLAVAASPVPPQVGSVRTAGLEREASAFVATRYIPSLDPAATTGVRAVADLDGDGDLDLVLGEGFAGTSKPTALRSYLNDGSGAFSFAHSLPLDTSASAGFSIALDLHAADVTGDEIPDLVYERLDNLGTTGPPGVLLHRGLGDGSFGPPLLIDLGGPIQDLDVADANADGVDDVLIVGIDDTSTRVAGWWSFSGGDFLPLGPLFDASAYGIVRVVPVDLNDDGAADFAATVFPNFDRLFLFETVAGAVVPAGEIPLPAAYQDINHALRSGDVNGDGHEDIVLSRLDLLGKQTHVLVLLGAGDGTFAGSSKTFAAKVSVPYGPPTLCDWDADGDLDLVTGQFAWFENRGGELFEAGSVRNDYVSLSSAGPIAHVADFDEDGHPDALSLWGIFPGDGRFPGRVSQELDETTLTGFSLLNELRDWEGDGDLDFVSTTRLDLNRGDGTFETRSFGLPQGGLAAFEGITAVGWDDFDQDGLDEVVARITDGFPTYAFLEMRLYDRAADGSWSISPLTPFGVEIVESPATGGIRASGDVDGDGDPDLLGTDGYWANDGAGVFEDTLTPAFLGEPLGALDLDRDGYAELLVQRLGDLRLLWNERNGSFSSSVLQPQDPDAAWTALDADEDGDLDLAVEIPGDTVLRIHPQTTSGVLAPPVLLPVPGVKGAGVALSDVEGDGRGDLLVQRTSESSRPLVCVFPRLQGLAFGARVDWVSGSSTAKLFDLDADGDVDAVGQTVFDNLRHDGPTAGGAFQYGGTSGIPGSGGLSPWLGTPGPVRGGEVVPLHLARGLGGTHGWLLFGTGRSGATLPQVPGLALSLGQVTSIVPIQLGGSPGSSGVGTSLTSFPIPLELAGELVGVTALLVDPAAPLGYSTSNGLELDIGGPGQGSFAPRTRTRR